MKCTACGESNEAGMQFCIFCGQSMAGPVQPPPAITPIQPQMLTAEDIQAIARPMGTSQSMVLLCTVCNKTDPLNGQFCVHCGGKTVAAPAAQNASNPAAYTAASQTLSSGTHPAYQTQSSGTHPAYESKNISEEYSRTFPQASRGGASIGGPIAIVLAVILGAGAAFSAVYLMKSDLQREALNSHWPKEGVLVLSSVPNADLKIEDIKHKSLFFGRTSKKGTLHLSSISPGAYKLELADNSGKKLEKEFNVNAESEANLIGYPQRLEVK